MLACESTACAHVCDKFISGIQLDLLVIVCLLTIFQAIFKLVNSFVLLVTFFLQLITISKITSFKVAVHLQILS